MSPHERVGAPDKGPRPLSSDVLTIDPVITRRHYRIRLIDDIGAWVSYEMVRLCFRSVCLQRLSFIAITSLLDFHIGEGFFRSVELQTG
jgi:hypothetical protein